ncbi:hypothetical protein F5Y15DRAFT_118600 [Xylariaceae sp. FL0016]|nr:hypothetical protein F5Y15DRAFT_118600 [Xylariaceae sp. FL0016]
MYYQHSLFHSCEPSSEWASLPQRPLRLSVIAELIEFVPATACSLVATSYMYHEDASAVDSPLEPAGLIRAKTDGLQSSQTWLSLLQPNFLSPPAPGLVLGSCLVLGCSLSSYMHRRRDQDCFQSAIVATWALWAVCVGWSAGCDADMIILGILPWALSMAMPSSLLVHVGGRWLSSRERSVIGTVVEVYVGGEKSTFEEVGGESE